MVCLLFCYLGLFTWNARTGYLDTIAERTGLEIVGYVLSPVVWVKDQCVGWWNRYMALIDVADENARLREEVRQTRVLATLAAEDRAELDRLRALLRLDALTTSPAFAARVITKRFGPNAARKTFTISKGFLDGALAGTPVATQDGVVGRVLRSAPHAATVLMLTDPGFRLAVISQESRTPGILTGSSGEGRRLEVAYVAQNAHISVGELLISSGEDNTFPKGIPVGVVTLVTPGNEILFQQVHAQPLVDLDRLEEVLLLQPEGGAPPLLDRLPLPVDPLPILMPGIFLPSPDNAPGAEQDSVPEAEQGSAPAAPALSEPAGRTAPPPPASAPARAAQERPAAQRRPADVIDSLQPSIFQTPPAGAQRRQSAP